MICNLIRYLFINIGIKRAQSPVSVLIGFWMHFHLEFQKAGGTVCCTSQNVRVCFSVQNHGLLRCSKSTVKISFSKQKQFHIGTESMSDKNSTWIDINTKTINPQKTSKKIEKEEKKQKHRAQPNRSRQKVLWENMIYHDPRPDVLRFSMCKWKAHIV